MLQSLFFFCSSRVYMFIYIKGLFRVRKSVEKRERKRVRKNLLRKH